MARVQPDESPVTGVESSTPTPPATILRDVTGPRVETAFNVPFVADLSLREKQIQQNYRPIIAVHKWFARRPGTLFRSLILSEFVPGRLQDNFYQSNSLTGIRIADPFMGGGTPLLEANRLGASVIGYDINPMAYWIVQQEIASLDLTAYREATSRVEREVRSQVGDIYTTVCARCGDEVPVKYFLWVKILKCRDCGQDFDLFPGYLLAENQRHPKNVLICPVCGDLNEVDERHSAGSCVNCGSTLSVSGPAARNRCACPHCGALNSYPNPSAGPPRHRMVAIEYFCPGCKPTHVGRFFKKPDESDLSKYRRAESAWAATISRFVPDEKIPKGDETDRLHRWGYQRYREMFNARQLLGLELICRAIADEGVQELRDALATNLSDLLRYQNMLCRYDTRALKSLDIFSVHGFPVGLVQCESNLFGITSGDANVGSGGWSNIVEKYYRAKQYCVHPFEVRHSGRGKTRVPIDDEWIGERRKINSRTETREVQLVCGNAAEAQLQEASLDAVLTDPPYFANVQYAELMDFCFVWLRRLASDSANIFQLHSTRSPEELTGNITMERGLTHFTRGLSKVFQRMGVALKPGSPLVFTYHHNVLDAYFPVAIAVLDAGLVCSATLPCPAEMGASIHINGTGSSVMDSVFVCRSTGFVDRKTIVHTPQDIANLVLRDSRQLLRAGIRSTPGDLRCIVFGHLIRLAIWALHPGWDATATVMRKVELIEEVIANLGGAKAVEERLFLVQAEQPQIHPSLLKEDEETYEVLADELPF